MRKIVYCVSLLVFFLWSCRAVVPHGGRPGDRLFLNAEVMFLNEAGKPFVNERGYVIETKGNATVITEETYTNMDGKVRLIGFYCTPLEVSANGGEIVINKYEILNLYTVIVRSDRMPNLEQSFGRFQPEKSKIRQSKIHETCG